MCSQAGEQLEQAFSDSFSVQWLQLHPICEPASEGNNAGSKGPQK